MKKKQLSISLVANLIAFFVNIGISFLLTPYIVNRLGDEAYGFIGLANNFVSYALIITTALNAMAARFITIEIHRENNEQANIYFNSVLIANFIMCFFLGLASMVIVLNISNIFNISSELVIDVQWTFGLVFLNFIITVLLSIFNIATFVKNRLELSSIRNIVGNVLKLILTIGLFYFLPPKIMYLAIATLISTLFTGMANTLLTKKILPEIKISFKKFKFNAVKMLISCGIWNSIGSLSSMLLTGLDLLIANIFIGGEAMGILSIAKTVPSAIQSLVVLIASVFTPSFTILYAKNKVDQLVNDTKIAMKIQAFIMTVPIVGFIVLGTDFYRLWLPNKSEQEIIQISILSFLTVLPWLLNSYIECLYSHNAITNKVKGSVIVTMVLGILSTVIVIILLKYTDLGIYAIAGVSSIIITLRILIFVPLYAAYVLRLNWKTYYPPIIKGILSFGVTLILFIVIKQYSAIRSWIDLIFVALKCGIIGYMVNVFIILDKNELMKLFKKIKYRIRT